MLIYQYFFSYLPFTYLNSALFLSSIFVFFLNSVILTFSIVNFTGNIYTKMYVLVTK